MTTDVIKQIRRATRRSARNFRTRSKVVPIGKVSSHIT